jgi:predicted RNA-binding protein with PIN domain
MHYFIDGYNLLFRLVHNNGNLQSQREAIILDLNQKISLVKIDVTVVFDAAFQMGDRSRSHYDKIEILFSAKGETADDYIVDEIINHSYPQQETVVTSDKGLAWRIRSSSAHTETVEEFILWLNKAYKNKLRQIKKERFYSENPPTPVSSKSIFPPAPSTPRSLIPSKDAPLNAYEDYYAQVFESGWQEILVKEEEVRKQALAASPPIKKRTPRKSKRPDPFVPAQTAEEKADTETERWQKIFEHKLADNSNSGV